MEDEKKTKVRKRKKTQFVELPKRAMSKYAIFVKENYDKIKQTLLHKSSPAQSTKHIVIMKGLKEKWTSMRAEEKRRYASLAEQDKERYMKEYDSSIDQIVANALK